jgi:hypothetical protein
LENAVDPVEPGSDYLDGEFTQCCHIGLGKPAWFTKPGTAQPIEHSTGQGCIAGGD